MRAKDQLYQYVEKRKQKIIDQYDRTLERINLSKGFESLISLMGDREMLLSIYGKSYDHNIKEILDIFSCIVDEMYQDNELFQNTTKEIHMDVSYIPKENTVLNFIVLWIGRELLFGIMES